MTKNHAHLPRFAALAVLIAAAASPLIAQDAAADLAAVRSALACYADAYNAGDPGLCATFWGAKPVGPSTGKAGAQLITVSLPLPAAKIGFNIRKVEVAGDRAMVRGTYSLEQSARPGVAPSSTFDEFLAVLLKSPDGRWLLSEMREGTWLLYSLSAYGID